MIAALLLAAAIQGIGYYQKNAYLYQMKSDALHAAETITAKVANTDGKFTAENVDAGVGDSKKTADATVEAEDGTSDAAGYVLRTPTWVTRTWCSFPSREELTLRASTWSPRAQ